jgi:hypothetical protein
LEFPLDFGAANIGPFDAAPAIPKASATTIIKIIFTASNKRTEHADVLLMHLKTCKSQPDGGL